MAFFSFKMYLYRIFWLEFEISTSEFTPVPNFSSTGQGITRILTWNDTKNGLMTSYLPPSDDVSKIFMAFESQILSQSTIMPSLVVIGPQIKEKQVPSPAYMVPKDPSLNRVKLRICVVACIKNEVR